jgi:HK97 family phage major capsid protein
MAEDYKTGWFETYVRKGDERVIPVGVRSDAGGGYVVPPEVEDAIDTVLAKASPIRHLSRVERGGDLPRKDLYAMPAGTAALLDDEALNLNMWFASETQHIFAEQETEAFIMGDGKAGPRGFLTYAIVSERFWRWGEIGKVEGPLDCDTLIDLIYTLKAGYRQNASWVMNRKTQAVAKKVKDGDGKYIWQPPASVDQNAVLLGFPVVECADMPDVGDDLPPIAFGDFRRAYKVEDSAGVSVLRDPYSAKPYVLFYTTKRVGGAVQDFDAIKLLQVR